MSLPIPSFTWLRAYDKSWLRGDVVAGLTLAAYLLPAGIADASLANLPPQAGLYACLCSGLVFWLFCSSRHTAITVTSAISLLVGASLGESAGGDLARLGALAAGTALLTALIALAAWAVRAGSIVNFISESVMVGFKCGVALLGRIPGTRRFSDRERHPDNETIPGVLVFRPEASLMYFNVEHVCDTIQERVRSEATLPRLVILDLSAAPYVDMQSAHTLAGMAAELEAAGVRLQVVEARSSVRDRLRAEAVDARLGGVNRFTTVADAVEALQAESHLPQAFPG